MSNERSPSHDAVLAVNNYVLRKGDSNSPLSDVCQAFLVDLTKIQSGQKPTHLRNIPPNIFDLALTQTQEDPALREALLWAEKLSKPQNAVQVWADAVKTPSIALPDTKAAQPKINSPFVLPKHAVQRTT